MLMIINRRRQYDLNSGNFMPHRNYHPSLQSRTKVIAILWFVNYFAFSASLEVQNLREPDSV
jgi:hypothetical protein